MKRNLTPEQLAHKKEYMQKWYAANKEKTATYNLEYQRQNRDKRRAIQKKHYVLHRESELSKSKVYQQEVRLKVLSHYSEGIPCCFCCGETHNEFLCLDHIEGGGNAHRKAISSKGGTSTYHWIIRNAYPDGFRVLCHNCNHALGSYGYCPHGTVESPAGELTKP